MAFDPVASLDLIERHRVTHMMMLPMMHRACVGVQQQQPRDLSSVTTAIYAMAPMPSELLDAVRNRGVAALIATHNPELAARMDRRVTLREGRVVEIIARKGEAAEAMASPGGRPVAGG